MARISSVRAFTSFIISFINSHLLSSYVLGGTPQAPLTRKTRDLPELVITDYARIKLQSELSITETSSWSAEETCKRELRWEEISVGVFHIFILVFILD